MGDRIVEANPEYLATHLAIKERVIRRGDAREVNLDVPEGVLVAAVGARLVESGTLAPDSFIDLRPSIANGKRLGGRPPEAGG